MNVKTLTPLITERLPDGERKLLEELVVGVEGVKIKVPKGFVTDFSSIPQPFAWLVRWSRVDMAGVVHDYLYRTGMLTRDHADLIWKDTAKAGEHHANPVQAWLGWLGLRLGGWAVWNRYRRMEKDDERAEELD